VALLHRRSSSANRDLSRLASTLTSDIEVGLEQPGVQVSTSSEKGQAGALDIWTI